ncbi:MAG: TonB-dependent receptor [Campylobacterota bacterium]|nr:TonB-dependent receptor [Campylobacterota bacterium]
MERIIKLRRLLFLIVPFGLYGVELEPIKVEDELTKASITTVDEETQINNQTLSQKLFNSVMINETTSHTNSSVVSIRGNSFRATEYYEDGVPLYKNANGYVDLSMYRANTANIKINAGGSQGLYSSSASGGEIVLSSKKLKSGFHAAIDTTLSTNDMFMNLHLTAKSDSFYWILDLNGMKRDYYRLSNEFSYTDIQATNRRVNADKEQLDGSFKLGYKIDGNSDIAFKVSHLESEYGLPVQVYNEPSNPFDTNADYTRVDEKALTSYWFYYDYKKSDLELSLRAYYDLYKDIYNFYDSPDFTTLKYDPSTYNDSRLGSVASLKYNYGKQHRGTYSLRVDKDIHEQVFENDPLKKQYEAVESSLSYMHDYKLSNDLSLAASIKYKQQNLTKAHQHTAENFEYKDNSAIDLQITADYRLNANQAYYLSLAKKSRFASLTELYPFFPWDTPNPNMKPEESDNIEMGATIKSLQDTAINLSLFYSSVDNKIVYESGYVNLEEATLQGFEVRVHNFTFDSHDIELSYAYTDAKDKEDEKIVQIPKSKLLLQDIIQLTSEASLNLSYLYVSSIDDIYNSNRHTLSSYSLVDAQISYEAIKDLTLKVGVKNLLDENWEYSYGQPSQGRTLFVGLKYEY